MATLYRNPSLNEPADAAGDGYTTKQEVDTRIPPKAAPVLAEISVNGVAIPESEILGEAQNHPGRNPGAALRAAAEALVVRELLWQEARRVKVQIIPARDEAGRLETERDAAIRLLIEEAVHVPSATEEECRRYYNRHRRKFCSEPIFEARHMLLAASEGDAAARAGAREQALALCRQLADSPHRFAEIALAHSDCPSREQGGNLGQLSRGSTVTEFEAAMMAMAEGEISARPVESRFGFHVIALDRKIEGRQLPFELVRERIAAWLEASAWSKAVSQYIAVLAGRAEISGISLQHSDGPMVQ